MSPASKSGMLSVVMPVYNEEHSIRSVILEHVAMVQRLPDVDEWEIVCVDDGSTDGTAELLSTLQSEVPQLVVERHARNHGIYPSFYGGYVRSRGRYIYATGSDGQWPAENLRVMYERLQGGADLVVGVRTNRGEIYPLARRIISDLFNRLSSLLFQVPVHDAGSVKLGDREIFTAQLISRSVFAEAERIVYAQRAGYRVEFVPIWCHARTGGQASGGSLNNLIDATVDLLRCFMKYRFGGRGLGSASSRLD